MKDVHIRIVKFCANSIYYSIQYKRVGWFKFWRTIYFTDNQGLWRTALCDDYEGTKKLASTLKTYADVKRLINNQTQSPNVEVIQ